MIVDNVSCRKKTNVLKKPKTSFLDNQIIEDDKGDKGGGDKGHEGGASIGDKGGVDFSDDDSDRHDETLDNNVQASFKSTRQFRNGS